MSRQDLEAARQGWSRARAAPSEVRQHQPHGRVAQPHRHGAGIQFRLDQRRAAAVLHQRRERPCRPLSPVGPTGSKDWLRTRTWARHAARWQLLPTRAAPSWKPASRVVVEQRCHDRAGTTMGRCMHLIGHKLRARSLPAQQVGVAITATVLNMMAGTAKTISVRVARQRTGLVRSASARSLHQLRS